MIQPPPISNSAVQAWKYFNVSGGISSCRERVWWARLFGEQRRLHVHMVCCYFITFFWYLYKIDAKHVNVKTHRQMKKIYSISILEIQLILEFEEIRDTLILKKQCEIKRKIWHESPEFFNILPLWIYRLETVQKYLPICRLSGTFQNYYFK